MTNRPDLVARLQGKLPQAAGRALSACLSAADAQGMALYLVGGAVRDLLRGETHVDLDLALEGAVDSVAATVADATGGRVVTHPRFGTATVKGEGFELDLAQARRETYARPGALPDVEPADLSEDLARRDFTVNAMALRLSQDSGQLIDPFGGQSDLERGLVRVLHEASFRDDATRTLRAVRYAARLSFDIEPSTAAWLKRDLAYVDAVSGARLRRELVLMLEEEKAVDGAVLARDLGVLRTIHPALTLSREVEDRWRVVAQSQADETGLCLLLNPATRVTAIAVAERLHLTIREQRALLDLAKVESVSSKLAASADDPVAVVSMLDGAVLPAVRALAIRHGGRVAEACEAYLGRWRQVRPHLRGDDLITLGVSPGPPVGQVLEMLRTARLQGRAETREDEIELVQRELKR